MTCKECKFHEDDKCVAKVPVWATWLMFKSLYECLYDRIVVSGYEYAAKDCEAFERRVDG